MNEIDLIRELPVAENAAALPDAAAKGRARAALAERSESTSPASTHAPRRGILALAGAGAVAGAVAAVLVLGSGPSTESAAAEALHETAAVAVSQDAPAASLLPGPGQFLYTKIKRVELRGWIPGCDPLGSHPCGLMGGTMNGANAFNALMPSTQEEWLGEDGAGRNREVAGTPRFLTSDERSRWEAAGSPLPPPFDPAYQRAILEYREEHGPPIGDRDEFDVRRGVADQEHAALKGFRFPDTSRLPTDPEELRLAVERNQIRVTGFNTMNPSAKRLDTGQMIAQLFNILQEGKPMTPQLRAAVFNALAELPGIEVDTDATDSLGRQGYAIRSGGGTEFIFDPDTSEMLAQREVLTRSADRPYLKGVPAGTTLRETDYLQSGIVDSTDETVEKQAGGPVATTGPVYGG